MARYLALLLLYVILSTGCGPPQGEQNATSGVVSTTESTVPAGPTIADVEARLTDVQRAALIAAARALRRYKVPSTEISPEHVVALRQVDGMLKSCIDDPYVRAMGLQFVDSIGSHAKGEALFEKVTAGKEKMKPDTVRAVSDVADALEHNDLHGIFRTERAFYAKARTQAAGSQSKPAP